MNTINLNEFQPTPLLEPIPLKPPVNDLPLPYVETQADYRPLGTAEWSHEALHYKDGDFWLGRDDLGNPIGLDDDRHILLNCKARGGEGTSYIVPNLCAWQGSTVVIDPKGENAILTARRRADGSAFVTGMGQKVKILDPFGVVCTDQDNFADIKGCYNPLDLIDIEKPESIDDAARIAESIVSSENTQAEPFWDDSARAILKSIILHVATAPEYKDDQRNLVTVRNLVLSGEAEMKNLLLDESENEVPGSFDLLFEGMRRNQAFGGVISRAGEQLLELSSRSDRTLASLIQVTCTHTEFLDSPQLQKAITQSDFDLSELKTRDGGMSLYLCLPQRFMETHHRWLRMMTSLTITEMERIRACGHLAQCDDGCGQVP